MKTFLFYIFIAVALELAPEVHGGTTGEVGSYTQFEFHNKESGTDILASVTVEEVTYENTAEFLTNFSASKDTKFVIHGWMNSDDDDIAELIIGSYLPLNDYNVIFVNWANESYQTYPRAVQAVSKVAVNVANLIDVLVENYSASLDKIHIVGHSLGAHIAGIAGLNVESGNVSRVTGLDPAKPYFRLTTANRLRTESANFVDVIHTCSNVLSFSDALGDVDFYPNEGVAIQPGCGLTDLLAGICSHGRSFEYFAESIKYPKHFLSTQCDSWSNYTGNNCDENPTAYMGEYVSTSAQGSYYLETNSESPYGQGSDS